MASATKKVIYVALAGNLLIAVTKFTAATITGSSAMLSEGIHSIVDVGNQLLLLFGIKRSQQPPDEMFPFGHGKEIYFWSFIVAILIFAVGAGVSVYEGMHQIAKQQPIDSFYINYAVLGLAIIFEGAVWYVAFSEFRKIKGSLGFFEAVHRGKDPTMFVVLFEDSAALLSLVFALVGIALSQITGSVIFDGIASLLIGLVLAATAVWLAYETKGLLIGERAKQQVIDGIREIARKNATVNHINEILTMHMGPDFILLNLSVDFRDKTLAPQIETAIAEIDAEIKRTFPEVKRIFIEAESRL